MTQSRQSCPSDREQKADKSWSDRGTRRGNHRGEWKAVFEKLYDEAGCACLWERGKCGHTASCQEGAKNSADVFEPWCITLSQGAPAPLVLWRLQNPRRQRGFPASQDASLCTKMNKKMFTSDIPATPYLQALQGNSLLHCCRGVNSSML